MATWGKISQSPYDLGYNCGYHGYPHLNPYPVTDPNHREYERGWAAAQEDLFNEEENQQT